MPVQQAVLEVGAPDTTYISQEEVAKESQAQNLGAVQPTVPAPAPGRALRKRVAPHTKQLIAPAVRVQNQPVMPTVAPQFGVPAQQIASQPMPSVPPTFLQPNRINLSNIKTSNAAAPASTRRQPGNYSSLLNSSLELAQTRLRKLGNTQKIRPQEPTVPK